MNFDATEAYYVQIEENYYQINLTTSGVAISREEKDISKNKEMKLAIQNEYDKYIIKNVEISNDEIIVTGGAKPGNTSLVIEYGDYTAVCRVKIPKIVNTIEVKDITLIEGFSKKIEIKLDPSDAFVTLTYNLASTDKVMISNEGIVTAKNLPIGKKKEVETITIKDEETGKTVDCNVTIKTAEGAFIEYDVSYQDVYNDYHYTKENGWRVLKYDKNEDGTYSNVELISTGIPAILNYQCEKQENNSWYETNSNKLESFKEICGGSNFKFYNGSRTYYGLQAAAGLYYNFANISFTKSSNLSPEPNKGAFKLIERGGKSMGNSSAGPLFRQSWESVRIITLPEINKILQKNDIYSFEKITETEDPDGLFRLDQLKNIPKMENVQYGESSAIRYWFASPSAGETHDSMGELSNRLVWTRSGGSSGLRPVVKLLGDNLKLETTGVEGVYQFK